MLLMPVVVVTAVFTGDGVVTGPVTVVSVEISPGIPTTTVLDLTPDVESARVNKTVFVVRPRQSYVIVLAVAAGSIGVVAGGKL
jgi:hypothetical protein